MEKKLLNMCINDAIQKILDTTQYFYQQNAELGYKNLDSTIMKIENVIALLHDYIDNNEIGITISIINNILIEAMNALASKDEILFADILKYEIVEEFQKLI